MYYNIAKRVVEPSMQNNYKLITNVTNQVQKSLNSNAGIGLNPITPKLNQDRINGIINRLSSEDNYDDVSWILDEPITNFSQGIVDDSIRANSEFQGKAGMRPKIVRKLAGGCCDWCREVAGVYSYPDVPKDVYRRHQRCRCTVEYNPGTGKRQNVHSKAWNNRSDDDIINTRKIIGLSCNNVMVKGISDHVLKRMQERSVNAEEIIDAIQNPLKITDVKVDEYKRPSFQAIGEKASIAINPNNGVITSTWPTSLKRAKKLLERE